jgi:hypothetical protein
MERKVLPNISHKHQHGSPQQNISKPNPFMFKKYTTKSGGIYSRYARLV